MAENYDYSEFLARMLDQVSDSLDKREGSVPYLTLAPTAFELARQTYMLAYLFNLLFADTATGEWLTRLTADFGIDRNPATRAVRKIRTYAPEDVPLGVAMGSRFAVEECTYTLQKELETGVYEAVCEQSGTVGNRYGGDILPADNINGLGRAFLESEPYTGGRRGDG